MNPQQAPGSYLDQIAPTTSRLPSSFKGPRLLVFLGLGLVVIVLILVIVINVINGGRKEPWQRLIVRLDSTEQIANSATGEIKSSKLRSLNSEIKLFLTNTKRDLAAPLVTYGIESEMKKLPTSITTEEAATPALERLEDARLNAVYDRAYAREMTYQLALVLSLLGKLYETTSNAETKTFLKTTYDNLYATHQQLSDYSASND